MNLYFWFFLLYALLITPVGVQLSIRIEQGIHYRVKLRVAGLPVLRQRDSEETAQEKRLSSAVLRNGMKKHHLALLASLFRQGHIQQVIKSLDWQKMEVNARISFADAAQTALAAALLRTSLETFSRCHSMPLYSHIIADFNGQGMQITIHCIVAARVGSLSAAAIRLWLAAGSIQAKRLSAEEERYAAASH